jgi:hypothetical protein
MPKSQVRMKIMRVVVRPGSVAEKKRHPRGLMPRPAPDVLAPGFRATPQHDLRYRGGHTIAHLQYLNFFVGGAASWAQGDVDNISGALARAMSDERLNNVMRQYFSNQPITTKFLGSHYTGSKRPALVTETSAKKLVAELWTNGQLGGIDVRNTVVNILLPRGTVLTDGSGKGRLDEDGTPKKRRRRGAPEAEEASSLEGLGGYHGSVDVSGRRIYFAVGVYSERLANGRENGIAVFDASRQNVVATFYHELNEARTDPDVDDAIRTGRVKGVIGWNSDEGEECGDFPVYEAGQLGNLALAFQQVHGAGAGALPVQLQYSNAVHGPEGPIDEPHHLQIPHEMAA